MAEEAITDEDAQFRIKVVSLFESGGWRLWEDRLLELKECYLAERDKILSQGYVSNENMALLSRELGKVLAINAVLAIKDELVEQITPSDGDTSEEVTRE